MNVELGCASFSDKNKGKLNFPPNGTKKYFCGISVKELKSIIEKIKPEDKLVIPTTDFKKAIEEKGIEVGE